VYGSLVSHGMAEAIITLIIIAMFYSHTGYSNVDQWGGIMKKTLIEEFGNELFVKHFGDWMKVFARVYSHHNGQLCSHLLGKIVCPTLILHGTEDGLVYPKHGRLLHENIKGSRLILTIISLMTILK